MIHKAKKRRIIDVNILILVLSIVWAAGTPLWADTQVSISLSDNLVTIGDRINVKIIVKTTETIDQIKLTPQKGEFEVLDQKPTQSRKQEDYSVFEKDMQVAFFKTGEFDVGPFSVELLQGEKSIETKTTNSVPVTVKSVLTEEDKDIKDLKSPIEVKGDPFYVLKYVILALVIIFTIIFLIMWLRKRRKKTPVEQPQLSALEELITRIRELSQKKYHEKGNPKLHFLELTQILKHFLYRKYNFNAEDLTTYETMLRLSQKDCSGNVQDSMRFLFNTADLVKFAKFIPDAPVMTEVFNKLEQIVTHYKQEETAVATPPQAGSPGQPVPSQPAPPPSESRYMPKEEHSQ